jgi:hypothetical protein
MDIIKEYIKLLVIDFELDENELLAVWMRAHPEGETPVSAPIVADDEKVLLEMKKTQLQTMCKERKLPITGAKTELINRLMNRVVIKKKKVTIAITEDTPAIIIDEDEKILLGLKKDVLQTMCKDRSLPASGSKPDLIDRLLNRNEPKPKKTKTKTKKPKNAEAPVLSTLTAKTLNVRRNDFGNYEDLDTGFIFDPSSNIVVGKQNPDGSIDNLVLPDVEKCIELKYAYRLPTNLE